MAKPNFKKSIESRNSNIGDDLKELKSVRIYNFKFIPYDHIMKHPNNKWEVKRADVEELKESIATYGLHHNLVIIPIENDEFDYMLLAGEVRYTAIGELLKEGDTQFTEGIPCKIVPADTNATDQEIIIEETNLKQRSYDPANVRKAIERLNNAVKSKFKDTGIKIKKGDVVKEVAEIAGVGERQIQRVNAVNSKLIPELKKAFDESKLSLDKAAEFAQLDESTQKFLADQLDDFKKMNNDQLKTLKEQLEKKEEELIQLEEQQADELREVQNKLEEQQKELERKLADEKEIKDKIDSMKNQENPDKENILMLNEELKKIKQEKATLEKDKEISDNKFKKAEDELLKMKQKADESGSTVTEEEKKKIKESLEIKELLNNINLNINRLSGNLNYFIKNHEESLENIEDIEETLL